MTFVGPSGTRWLAAVRASAALLLPGIALTGCRGVVTAHASPREAKERQGSATSVSTAIRFRDVAAEAGLEFRLGHGGRTPLTILETLGQGAAFLDYDGDGWLDILLLSDRSAALYRNTREGRFTEVTGATGAGVRGYWHGVATGDMDNDGDADLCLVGYRSLAVLRNDAGRFTNVTPASGLDTPGWGSSAAFTDLDGDGRLDLVVGEYLEFGPKSVQFCTIGYIKTACGPKIYPPRFPRVYRNAGGSRFRDVTREWGFGTVSGKALGIATGDFNGDGRTDVAIANDEMPQDLFLRLPGKPVRYENAAVEWALAYLSSGEVQSGMGIDAGDANGDGRDDLIITNFQYEPDGLYRNDGGFFTEVSAPSGLGEPTHALVGWGTRFLDADNDGDLDLLIANGHIQDNVHLTGAESSYGQPLLCLDGDGRGAFRSVGAAAGEPFARRIVGRGLATGDYDNDGRVDALVVDIEGRALLLHNESTAGHHWIGFEPVAGSPLRPALGALVTVETARGKQQRRAGALGSIFSAHDPRVQFGLAREARVASVTVQWPNGRRERFPVPAINGYHRLVEGRGRVDAGRG
jgi:enediyne biosynthesis protein E4